MRYVFILLVCVSAFSCIPKVTKLQLADTDIEYKEAEPVNLCKHNVHNQPDSNTAIRYVRVNVHFFRDSAGLGNFSTKEGIQYAHDIIAECNKKLANNKKMKLPKGNNTPVLPTKIRFVITPQDDIEGDDGIYFHDNSNDYYYSYKGRNRNYTKRDLFHKYGVGKGEIINIFIQSHHRDSVKSKYYGELKMKGIAFPNEGFVKVTGLYAYSRDTMYYNKQGEPVIKGPWFCAGHINHEIGHVLGLHHTWSYNDGCDDTPKNQNCWAWSKKPPCNKNVSNNVMDYNTHQSAWSPCQLGKVHQKLSQTGSKTRRYLIPNWCDYDETKTVRLYDDEDWLTPKDIRGDIIVGNAVVLTINCTVNMPKGSKIIVKPRGKLVLNGASIQNACGEEWNGIEIWDDKKTKGRVVYQNNPTLMNVKSEEKEVRP